MRDLAIHRVAAPLFSVFNLFRRLGKFNGLNLNLAGRRAVVSGHDCHSTGCSLLKSLLESEGYEVSPGNSELGVI